MNFILASASPRRQELLKLIINDFTVCPANIDETLPNNINILSGPEFLAIKKAEFVASTNKDCIVIGSDTAVFIENEMLGKPKDGNNAEKMLKKLSNRTHTVITGCAVSLNDKTKSFCVKTEVTFTKLTDKMISDYIKTKEPFDKAGGYGIQGPGAVLIEGINGDYYNVMGLPVCELNRQLKSVLHYL